MNWAGVAYGVAFLLVGVAVAVACATSEFDLPRRRR